MANDTPKSTGYIVLAVFVTTLSIILFVIFNKQIEIEPEHPLVGMPAPQIEFAMPDGKSTSLKDQQGVAILLNFWAVWCEPCMDEMPSLKALENHFKNKGLLVLAINIQDTEADNIKMKISGNQMPTNLIFSLNKENLHPYDIQGVPMSVLIDSKGVVRKIYTGPRDWVTPSMISEIQSVIKG